MASLFKPTYTRAVPAHAKIVTIKGVKYARWVQRGGNEVTAPLSKKNPARCEVESECYWIKYRDQNGKRCFRKAYKDERASERNRLDLETTVERIRAGDLPAASLERRDRPLSELVGEWEEHLKDNARSEKHVAQTVSRVDKVVAAIRASRPVDLTASAVERHLARMRATGENFRGKDEGWSVQTSNHHLAHLKSFTRWLVDHGHLDADPLARLKKLNADAARAFERRSMTDDEFWKLIDTTAASLTVRRNYVGLDRAMCYLTAGFTGLRLGELAELSPTSFVPHGDQYRILLPAADQKNKKELPVFLPKSVAARLKAYLAAKPADEQLWNRGGWAKNGQASWALYRDLEDAKIPIEKGGKRLDFHSLRTHFQTSMLLKGIPVPHATRLARLSSPATMMKHYARLGLDELAAEVEKLSGSTSKGKQ